MPPTDFAFIEERHPPALSNQHSHQENLEDLFNIKPDSNGNEPSVDE